MQQFVPFEDDWETLEAAWAQALVPYRVGMALAPGDIDRRKPAQLSNPGSAAACPASHEAMLAIGSCALGAGLPCSGIDRGPSHPLPAAI